MRRTDQKPRVAFQGEHGAFSEDAAGKLFSEPIETVPRRTFADLYRSLESGVADYILAPVENTITGSVRESVELLGRSNLKSIGEVKLPVVQNLIAYPGTLFEDVRLVQSHPVALQQCCHFLNQNPQLKALEADDTAGSVAEVMRCKEKGRAAIAGKRAAELYGASILREGIQDRTDNFTRFVLLSSR